MTRTQIETLPIPRYDADGFNEALKANPDLLLQHPCVIRGFTERWRASRRWTSFDSLTELFGTLPVTAGAPQFTTHKHAKMCQVRTDFATYLQYVQDPACLEALFRNRWSQGSAELLRELDLPLYCGNLRIARHSQDAVFSDVDPLLPPSLECLNNEIPYYYQCGNHLWLYVSLAGALTPLHQDNNSVFSYLGQLRGEKRAILYSPADRRHYHNSSVGYLDPLDPNDVDFPTWREAQPWWAVLSPGELLIWGPDWAHHVVTLSRSITVSFDFVNFANLEDYSRSVEWRLQLGRFVRKNADLIRARVRSPGVHKALESACEEDLGKEIMIYVLSAALHGPSSAGARPVKERMLATLTGIAEPPGAHRGPSL